MHPNISLCEVFSFWNKVLMPKVHIQRRRIEKYGPPSKIRSQSYSHLPEKITTKNLLAQSFSSMELFSFHFVLIHLLQCLLFWPRTLESTNNHMLSKVLNVSSNLQRNNLQARVLYCFLQALTCSPRQTYALARICWLLPSPNHRRIFE